MEFRPVEQMTYTEALAELEAIVAKLRADNCDVDTLTVMTRRAVSLLNLCRSRLTATEQELKTELEKLQT